MKPIVILLLILAVCQDAGAQAKRRQNGNKIEGKDVVNAVKTIFEKKKDKNSVSEKPVKKADPTSMGRDLVLATVFPNAKTGAGGEVIWKPKSGTRLSQDQQDVLSDDGQFRTAIDTVLYFTDNGAEHAAAVLLTYRYYLEGNALEKELLAPPALGLVTYAREPDKTWKVFNANVLGAALNSFDGEDPSCEVLALGPGLAVMALRTNYRYNEYTSYIGLGNAYFFQDVLGFDSRFAEGGMDDPTIRTPRFLDAPGSGYKTIALEVRKGGRLLGTETFTFSETERKYVKKSGLATKPKATAAKPAPKKPSVPKPTTPKPKAPTGAKVKGTTTMKMD